MEQSATLATFYENWKSYQDHLKDALAPLTPEQMAQRPGQGLRTVGEIAAHIVSRAPDGSLNSWARIGVAPKR